MKKTALKKSMECAALAAQTAGNLMLKNAASTKKANFVSQHDIKLELDVRSQKLIEKILLAGLPESAVLGEEGVRGDQTSALRWVVDPIDGTVNYAYGIPHACVSIALQEDQKTVLGVVYDPFNDELWTAIQDGPACLNGKKIHASPRKKLEESIVSIGFAKEGENANINMSAFNALLPRVRKMRMMGSAALSLTYVACGRFDGYVEMGVRLWDIAAGGFIVDRAGGQFWSEPWGPDYAYRMIASNGIIADELARVAKSKRPSV
jgi:myo-inositol-1(or 4)-monophosphatase